MKSVQKKISIIMPVFNEANNLKQSLSKLHLSDDEELIVVDGGSTDNTRAIAREFTHSVFKTSTGRASVMNFGAGKASGEILLFLHADCILPANAFDLMRDTLSDNSVAAGAFFLRIDHRSFIFRIIEFAARARSRATSLLYGDQGMFLEKAMFDRLGGFADIPLMEDIEISLRLKKMGRIAFANATMTASPRRWMNEGIAYTTFRDWWIAFCYTFLKHPPEKLIRYYKDVR